MLPFHRLTSASDAFSSTPAPPLFPSDPSGLKFLNSLPTRALSSCLLLPQILAHYLPPPAASSPYSFLRERGLRQASSAISFAVENKAAPRLLDAALDVVHIQREEPPKPQELFPLYSPVLLDEIVDG